MSAKKIRVYVDARAHPSCLLVTEAERAQVLAITVTVSTEATQLGKIIRNRLMRLASDAIREATQHLKIPGVPRPSGGFGVSHPYTLTTDGQKIRAE